MEEGERSRQEIQGAAQQGKAAEVQVKALQARLTRASEATASIGRDLAEARTQVSGTSLHCGFLSSSAQCNPCSCVVHNKQLVFVSIIASCIM